MRMKIILCFLTFIFPMAIFASPPDWMADIILDVDTTNIETSYLEKQTSSASSPGWYDLGRYPYPQGEYKSHVNSIPGETSMKIPEPEKKSHWWKIPIYVVIGFPRDIVDISFGVADKVPIFGGISCIVYQMIPLNYLFRHPDDWYLAGLGPYENDQEHSLTYGLLDGWCDPGFFSNLRCTKWSKTDYTEVNLAKNHNKRIQQNIENKKNETDTFNANLKTSKEEYINSFFQSYKRGKYRETYIRYNVLDDVAEEIYGDNFQRKLHQLRIIGFISIIKLAEQDNSNHDWFLSEINKMDKRFLDILPSTFDNANVRARGLILLAQIRGDFGNAPQEGLRILDEVFNHYNKNGKIKNTFDVVRWVKIPLLYKISLKSHIQTDVFKHFNDTITDAILNLSNLSRVDLEYSENLRVDFLNILSLFTQYEVKKTGVVLDKTIGYQILLTLESHKNVAWRQQARELVNELEKIDSSVALEKIEMKLNSFFNNM